MKCRTAESITAATNNWLYAACLALSVGALIKVPSERDIDYARLQRRIEKMISGPPA